MSAIRKNSRKDITICTMLFKMPDAGNLAALNGGNRSFEEFYLPSLKKLCESFDHIALWCDSCTVEYLKANGLADKVNMNVMEITELPHWAERESYCQIMHSMKHNVGYFLHRRSPEMWTNYLPLMFAKAAVVDWAAKNNKFNSDYFMWMDGGAFSPKYANSPLWDGWTGVIDAKPKRVRMTIAKTLGKSRPHYVPRFVYDLYKFLFGKPILPANAERLVKQRLVDIAMVNADYDVPGGCFMVPKELCCDFYAAFERARKIMKKHSLVCVDQGIFQAMMKLDTDDLFELKYITGYQGLYAKVATGGYDILL
ncbi:MAG: hypothetical protein IKZ34_01825 [Alphaproteobacteria bacterium]|nr:hypothetical protein [Alphaproteobacteria bacterium]